MFRKLLLTTSAAVLMLALHTAAQAAPVTIAQGQSVTFVYQTSNSNVNATATFTLTGNVLTVSYTNTSNLAACTGQNCSLTGVGFDVSPDINITNTSISGSKAGTWSFSTNGGGLGGFENRVFGSGGVNNGLSAGQTQTAQFTLSATLSSLTIDLTQVHFQSIPPNGNSEKPTGTPVQPVPEPATMLLLGTGLAGVAAKVRRRRKQAQS